MSDTVLGKGTVVRVEKAAGGTTNLIADASGNLKVNLASVTGGSVLGDIVCDDEQYVNKSIAATTASATAVTLTKAYFVAVFNESSSNNIRIKINGTAATGDGILIPPLTGYENAGPMDIAGCSIFNEGATATIVSVQFLGQA
jgi:hypothetical protein